MHHTALREKLRPNPFQPLRLVLSNGKHYDIRSPEWMLVTGMTTAVGIPGEAGDGDNLHLIDNAQINQVEQLVDADRVAAG